MEVTSLVVSRRQEALLVGDYHTYQTRLSHRLQKLRKRLGRSTPKGKTFTELPTTSEDVERDPSFAYLPLFSAERAWATAMQMKSAHSASASSKGITGSTRTHIITRLNKAVVYARQLVHILENIGSSVPVDILEAHGYLASLQGTYYMEKRHWDLCLDQYSTAKVIYDALGKQAQEEAFRDFLANTIDPGLRYAAYQLKLPRTTSLDAVAIRHFSSEPRLRSLVQAIDENCLSENTSTSTQIINGTVRDLPQEISWRGRTVKIEDAAISQALAKASLAESDLLSWLSGSGETSAETKGAKYDEVIMASQDALDATKSAIEELTSEGIEQSDKRIQSLQVTRTAVNYALIGWQIGRNRILCGTDDGFMFEPEPSAHRSEEITGKRLIRLNKRVVLYDGILQNLDVVKELPGVLADSAFVAEIDAKRAYFQSLRCVAIARAHALVSEPTKALALLARAQSLVLSTKRLDDTPNAEGPPRLEIPGTRLKALHSSTTSLVWQYRGIAEIDRLAAESHSSESVVQPPLVARLDKYPVGEVNLSRLVNYPPQLEPVPVKPLFLDVAWNYIDYPGTRKAVANQQTSGQSTQSEKKQTKRSWFGFGR